MNPFYYHLRNCWKQTALRSEPNKECMEELLWPSGTAALPVSHVTNRSLKITLQITPPAAKQANQVFFGY